MRPCDLRERPDTEMPSRRFPVSESNAPRAVRTITRRAPRVSGDTYTSRSTVSFARLIVVDIQYPASGVAPGRGPGPLWVSRLPGVAALTARNARVAVPGDFLARNARDANTRDRSGRVRSMRRGARIKNTQTPRVHRVN